MFLTAGFTARLPKNRFYILIMQKGCNNFYSLFFYPVLISDTVFADLDVAAGRALPKLSLNNKIISIGAESFFKDPFVFLGACADIKAFRYKI